MSELTDLAVRVEAATGPDRELDALRRELDAMTDALIEARQQRLSEEDAKALLRDLGYTISRKWSPDDEAALAEAWNAGGTEKPLMARFGLSKGKLAGKLRRLRLDGKLNPDARAAALRALSR
jgi:hypothetical protein